MVATSFLNSARGVKELVAQMTIALFQKKKTAIHFLVNGKAKEQHAKIIHALLHASAMSLAMGKLM